MTSPTLENPDFVATVSKLPAFFSAPSGSDMRMFQSIIAHPLSGNMLPVVGSGVNRS